MSQPFSLDVIQVAAPCHASWEGMQGDARVRHCGECQKNVYNLSSMSRADAEALLLQHEGKLCVRFYRRTDGTLLTNDCPVGLLARAHRRLAGWFAAAAAALLTMAAFGNLLGRDWRPSSTGTATTGGLVPTTFVPQRQMMVMGEAVCPTPPTPAPPVPASTTQAAPPSTP